MAAEVHCESSRQLGFALSYTPPSTLKGEKTVFMVNSNVYFDWTIYQTGSWTLDGLSLQNTHTLSLFRLFLKP